MNRLTRQIIDAGFSDRVLTERQLARILGGSDDSRYALVKRGLQSGELVKVRRGRYVLADRFRSQPVHPFHLAQAFVAGSYVSMESALAFHGWIPEAVYSVANVTPGRKSSEVTHPQFGRFTFHPLAVHRLGFLTGIERHVINDQPMLVACPLRALMDLVAFRKQDWKGLDWLTEGLRIDSEHLHTIGSDEFEGLRQVYKHKAVRAFLDQLELAITTTDHHQKEAA